MNTIIVKVITVILKLSRLSVANVVETVESILSKMAGNANFTTPNPSLASIGLEKDDLKATAAAAQNGSRAAKALVKVKLRILLLSMSTLRAYVQTVANTDASTAEQVALSSGMGVKRITPRGKRIFTVRNTTIPGQVKMFTGRVKHATAYDFEYKKATDTDAGYVSAGILPSATRTVSGLISTTPYSFRWCSISKTGRSAWSNIITIVVM